MHDPGNDQRHPYPPGHLHRRVNALIGMDPAEEQEEAAVAAARCEGVDVDAVVDRRGVSERGVAVGVTDGDVVGDVVVRRIRGHDPLGREAVDRRGHRCRCEPAVGQREEVELVGDQVELVRPLKSGRDVQAARDLRVDGRVLLVPSRRYSMQPPRGRRVGGGEKRDVVAPRDQSLGYGRGHLLPRAVRPWWRAVGDRRQDGDPHAGLQARVRAPYPVVAA